jgi:hypothetical protein
MKINHLDLISAALIIVFTIFFSYLIYTRTFVLGFFVGPFRFSHWLSIIGTIYIAVATPLFVVLKRRKNANWIKLVRFHIFGNLLFFGFISLHYAAQMSRGINSIDVGTGAAMYTAMALQVALGFTTRFRIQAAWYNKLFNTRTNRFIHASLVMVFYIVILFHVIHGLNIA